MFKYMIEYLNGSDMTDGQDIKWLKDNKIIYLLEGDTKYYKSGNEWYNTDFNIMYDNYIPDEVDSSTIRLYFPRHSVDTYAKNIKYAITAHTWINGHKINLGSSIFSRLDTLANANIISNGNDQYYEYLDMDIIDPYDIMYSDKWLDFRHKLCNEPLEINNTGALLNVSLYIVEEYDNHYNLKDDWIGGYTVFNICNETTEFMQLSLSHSISPLGWEFKLTFNQEYDWLLTYLNETYGIKVAQSDIRYELVLKSKDTVIPGPIVQYDMQTQLISYSDIINFPNPNIYDNINRKGFAEVFKSWNNFEEGWFVVSSLSVVQNGEEIISIVSNPIPLTQEIFKYFITGTEKLIDIKNPKEMTIIDYHVANKIENKIIQVDRPDNSKSNIIQPVFFKVKDVEKLTLHPAVTENICINLDDYKSKVKTFKLQIEGCVFEQIGVNQYGVLFKVIGSSLPNKIPDGTYYILNEDSVLVTTGKYKYVL